MGKDLGLKGSHGKTGVRVKTATHIMPGNTYNIKYLQL
jgi:hypothetical protein